MLDRKAYVPIFAEIINNNNEFKAKRSLQLVASPSPTFLQLTLIKYTPVPDANFVYLHYIPTKDTALTAENLNIASNGGIYN